MAIGLQYTTGESGAIGMGQLGSIFTDDTVALTGLKIVAFQILDETSFTTLTPETSDFPGTAGGSGNAMDSSNTLSAGTVIYGQWTGYALAKGTVIAYRGKF